MAGNIRYWNRSLGVVQEEQVFGEGPMKALYQNRLLSTFLKPVMAGSALFSDLYGAYQSTSLSAHKIPKFIDDFSIPMHEFNSESYRTFNDFFIRSFKPGARSFPDQPNQVGAFAEGRYLCYPSSTIQGKTEGDRYLIKGVRMNAKVLSGLDGDEWKPFDNGPVAIARLCPVDYHRFHYPDSGKTLRSFGIPGGYDSVNPIALETNPDILFMNGRHVSILETNEFGKIAYVEVGAMGVGRIVQSHDIEKPFKRGDEKGYFLFGGSTVVAIFEKGRIEFDADVLAKNSEGLEVFLKLGECFAKRVN